MIQLMGVRLINWYGFQKETIPIGNFTLIAGKNGNGKSVLLDAIKYALYGDTVFNKSTENDGSRTVSSYTRGLLDATAGTYMRPAARMPNVYTHIVLEFQDSQLGNRFLLGTVIDTDAGNNFITRRYVVEQQTLEQMAHTEQQENQEIPYSSTALQKKYNLRLLDVKDGLARFMQRTGLRLSEQQLIAFRRKLRSIMSYDPNSKIDQFIREKVLEEKTVDFTRLIEAKSYIDGLHSNLSAIEAELQELKAILQQFQEFQSATNILIVDDVKRNYRDLLCSKREESRARAIAQQAALEEQQAVATLQQLDALEQELRDAHHAARRSLEEMDCARAILETEQQLQQATALQKQWKAAQEALMAFQATVQQIVTWLEQHQKTVEQKDILTGLLDGTYTSSQKELTVGQLQARLQQQRDELVADAARAEDRLRENKGQQQRQQQLIQECDARKTTYAEIPEYVGLKQEINREFEKRGIQSQARFACEYVIGLEDEGWRDTLESYLGRRRYTILVEPEYYDIADDVLNRSKHRYAHLFNTKLLMQKTVHIEEDSVVHLIQVKNSVAKQYFAYQLGRFHKTTRDQVKLYENAMSQEGRVSVAMDSYYLNFKQIRFYCLGQETIALNRKKAVQELTLLREAESQQLARKAQLLEQKQYLEQVLTTFQGYDYDACQQYQQAVEKTTRLQQELLQLQEAQKNNTEYMELAQRVGQLADQLKETRTQQEKTRAHQVKQGVVYQTNEKIRMEQEARAQNLEQQLSQKQEAHGAQYEKAIHDYDAYLNRGETGVGGILKQRERAESRLRTAAEDLRFAQQRYNISKTAENQLPTGTDVEAAYQARREKIWMDNLQEIRETLQEQTRRYEDIFKNEFVLTVLKSCESAMEELKLMNRELSHLDFKAKYAFDVKYVKDGSDYEKILQYARYLKEQEELGIGQGQLTFQSVGSETLEQGTALEADIKRIIEEIVSSNSRERMVRYADYRNYMTYDLTITNEVLEKSSLSKQAGYNSGAEVQIPYMLILISAMLMIYNSKANPTRLVFIDEPFAKMDPVNIQIMLGFMKKQGLQMVFCAPDKIGLLGGACDVILPVMKLENNHMMIGHVELH